LDILDNFHFEVEDLAKNKNIEKLKKFEITVNSYYDNLANKNVSLINLNTNNI